MFNLVQMQKEANPMLKKKYANRNDLHQQLECIKEEVKNKLDKVEENHGQENSQPSFEAQKKLSKHMDLHVTDIQKKEKCNWIKWNDDYTKYFHAKMSTKKHRNNINNLITGNDTLLKGQEKIDEEALDYFSNLYSMDSQCSDFPHIPCKQILNVEEKLYLNVEVSKKRGEACIVKYWH